MKNAIDEIIRRLRKHPEMTWTVDRNRITANSFSPQGFLVWLELDGDHATVGYNGWHEKFDSIDDALDCFSQGFDDRHRLKVALRGASECAWTVEERDNGSWNDVSTTALMLVPFWRKKRIEYRQNRPVHLH